MNKNEHKPQMKQLGVEVEMESKKIENDPWANKMLKEIGTVMRVDGMRYVGSAAVHYYIEEHTIAKPSYSMVNKHQLLVGNMSEKLASMGLTNMAIEMKKYFGRHHSTTNTKDRRNRE